MGNKYNYVITNLTNNCIQSTLLYTCTYNLILHTVESELRVWFKKQIINVR